MEGEALYPRTVIRVAMDYRKSSPRAMKKAFLKIHGVGSVKVDPEEELVHITGEANLSDLLREAEKMGKFAQILSYEKEPPPSKKKKFKKKNRSGNRGSRDDFVHRAEAYVPEPSLFDSSICRDPYCLRHSSRPIIGQHLPEFYYSGYHGHRGGLFCEGRPIYGFRGLYEDHRANRCSIM